MPKREMFDSFCSADTHSSFDSPIDFTISDIKISDWYDHNYNIIFEIYTEIKQYVESIGLPILDKCKFEQFIDLCTKQSILHSYNIESDFSDDSE